MENPTAEDKDRISAASKSIDAALRLVEKLEQQVKLDELEKLVREFENERGEAHRETRFLLPFLGTHWTEWTQLGQRRVFCPLCPLCP